MSTMFSKTTYPFWLRFTVILLGLVLLFAVLSWGRFILMPLALSALLAILLDPLARRFERLKIGRGLAIVCSMLAVAVVLGGIVSLLSIQIMDFADQLPQAGDRVQRIGQDVLAFFERTVGIAPEQQVAYLQEGLANVIDRSGEYASTALGATTSVFSVLGLLPIFIFFMIYYKEMYHTFFLNVWSEENNEVVESVLYGVKAITKNYLLGLLTVMVILGVMNFIGLTIIGLENALFFAIFASVLAVIPYIGIVIGSLPAVLYALLFYPSLWMPFGVLIVFFTVQFLEGNFITPNIIGTRVSINPFMALIALLIGAEVWGIVGMIIFVPFVGILKCIFDEVPALAPYGYILGNDQRYASPPLENQDLNAS